MIESSLKNPLLMKDILVALMLIITSLSMSAQEREYFSHTRFSISGALTSSYTYELDFACHYMFCPFVGAGGSLGSWKVISEEGYASGHGWHIDSDDERPSNLFIRPSLVLKTPGIKIGQVHLGLYAEPSLMLNIPYQTVAIRYATPDNPRYDHKYKDISTNRGQWLAGALRLGINLDIGEGNISLGYMMSNLDVYSQYRQLNYNGTSFRDFYPVKNFMWGLYLTLGCCL